MLVAQICKNSGSSEMARNLNDKRKSQREINALTHVNKPHRLDPNTLAAIYAAIRERDSQKTS